MTSSWYPQASGLAGVVRHGFAVFVCMHLWIVNIIGKNLESAVSISHAPAAPSC